MRRTPMAVAVRRAQMLEKKAAAAAAAAMRSLEALEARGETRLAPGGMEARRFQTRQRRPRFKEGASAVMERAAKTGMVTTPDAGALQVARFS